MDTLKCWILCSILVVLHSLALAQNFTPSSSWRKPNITTSLDQRISIADDAIQKSLSLLSSDGVFNGSAFGTPGLLFAEMAEFDLATNQTKYESQLKQLFQTVEAKNPNFQNELYALNYAFAYGYAAARAYAAYKDPMFLNWAADNWSFGQNYTISPSEASSGSSDVKSFPIQSQCQSNTMAGGTYWNTDADNPSVNSLGTGYFLIVSALLAEATSNQIYLEAANQAASFIQSHLYNNSIVQDSISAEQNGSCLASTTTFSYNSGLMIEGLAILASLNTSDTQSLLLNLVAAAVSKWQGSGGVTINTPGDPDYVCLVRGLVAAYNRNPTNYELRNYLEQFLAVQYNAIIDQATIAGSNIYGASWQGPPATAFQADNQTISLIGLIGSIYLRNDTQPPANTSGSGSPTSSSTVASASDGGNSGSGSNKAAPIAGGIVGGLAFIAIVTILTIIYTKRKQQRTSELNVQEPPLPVPFMVQPSGVVREYNPYDAAISLDTTSGTGSTPPSVIVRREKQGRHQQNLYVDTSRPTQSSASNSTQSPYFRPTPSQPSGGPATGGANGLRDHLPTSELVRILNERLQAGVLHVNEEMPPAYPAGE